jgi:hypothetical protein
MFNHLNIRLFEILNSFGTSCLGFASALRGVHGIKLVGTNAAVLAIGAESVEATGSEFLA